MKVSLSLFGRKSSKWVCRIIQEPCILYNALLLLGWLCHTVGLVFLGKDGFSSAEWQFPVLNSTCE